MKYLILALPLKVLVFSTPVIRVKRQLDINYEDYADKGIGSEYYDYEYYYYNENGDQVDNLGNIIKPKEEIETTTPQETTTAQQTTTAQATQTNAVWGETKSGNQPFDYYTDVDTSNNTTEIETELCNTLRTMCETNELECRPGASSMTKEQAMMLQACGLSTRSNACGRSGCKSVWNIAGIWNYGCWCNFGAHYMEGKGAPVNVFDKICQNYQLCLRCARWDGKEDGYDCDPITESYNAKFDQSSKGKGFNAKCSAANTGACATHLCSCNMNFFAELLKQLWVKDNGYTNRYLHIKGFNRETECLATGTGHGKMKCCGYYPHRYPYGRNNSKRKCCLDHRLYNPFKQDCCSDGNVRKEGTCDITYQD